MFHLYLLSVWKGDPWEHDFLPLVQTETSAESGQHFDIFLPGYNRLASGGPSTEITALLRAWTGGDEAALSRLAERVYPELRLMARRFMKNGAPGNTLQATAVVHEVYLRLVDVTQVEFHQRAQFFAMAARIMRRILVDAARARGAVKRAGLSHPVHR